MAVDLVAGQCGSVERELIQGPAERPAEGAIPNLQTLTSQHRAEVDGLLADLLAIEEQSQGIAAIGQRDVVGSPIVDRIGRVEASPITEGIQRHASRTAEAKLEIGVGADRAIAEKALAAESGNTRFFPELDSAGGATTRKAIA